MWLTSASLTWTLALIGSDKMQKAALDTRHPCWDQHIRSILYIMLYDSKDVYWLSRCWLSSPLGTSCTGVRTELTSTMRRILCGASWHIIIPWVLFGMADDRYSKSSTNNRSWCTLHHITRPFALASPVLIPSPKWEAYNRLAGQYPCWRTELWFPGARSRWIKILSNRLPCPRHYSTHLAVWTTTVSGLLCCCIWLWRRSLGKSFDGESTIHGMQRSVRPDWRSYLLEMSKNRMSEHQWALICWYPLEMSELQSCCVCWSLRWCEVSNQVIICRTPENPPPEAFCIYLPSARGDLI